jgi:hypothetical protein
VNCNPQFLKQKSYNIIKYEGRTTEVHELIPLRCSHGAVIYRYEDDITNLEGKMLSHCLEVLGGLSLCLYNFL